MGFPYECPLPVELVDIPANTCPFRFDQIVRVGLQQRQTVAPFANAAALLLKANWDAFVNAADETKIVFTPIFSGFVIPASEPITAGGNDNSTFAGIPEYFGEGVVTATGMFKNLQSASADAMEHLTQYSVANSAGASSLTAWLFNKDGYGFYIDDASTFIQAMQIYNWRVGTPGSEGLNSNNNTPMGFTLAPNWSRGLKSFKPTDFNPITDY